VDTKGNITDVKVLRGIGGGCDEEAERVIKMMPQWHAGKQNGRSVRVLFTMPVIFKLQQR
jgi:protein TonB